jgi:hypothetical protein
MGSPLQVGSDPYPIEILMDQEALPIEELINGE